jgi:hypothetical protein
MDMGKVVLDDKVADDVSLTGTVSCRILLKRFEPAFAKALDNTEKSRPKLATAMKRHRDWQKR